MPRVTVSLDADLVLEVMVLAGVRDARDAVEVVLRDYLTRGHRTEAVTGNAPDARRNAEVNRRGAQGE
jgi:Arc/MetJ family transcription regulator